MTFPSTLSSFNRPSATDRLNSPSHSALHNTVSSALGQVEAVVGVDGTNSVVGTMMYDLRSAGSTGGGHVQGAAFGGTGQTTFNKGDTFVATSASVIAKLAVGLDGQIPVANSSVASGINWVNNSTPWIATSASTISMNTTTAESSLLSVTVPASTLGTSKAVRAISFINYITGNDTNSAVFVKGIYGTASVMATFGSVVNAFRMGEIHLNVIGNAAVNSQRLILQLKLYDRTTNVGGVITMTSSTISTYATSICQVDSTTARTLGITTQWNLSSGNNNITTDGYIVEKII